MTVVVRTVSVGMLFILGKFAGRAPRRTRLCQQRMISFLREEDISGVILVPFARNFAWPSHLSLRLSTANNLCLVSWMWRPCFCAMSDEMME